MGIPLRIAFMAACLLLCACRALPQGTHQPWLDAEARCRASLVKDDTLYHWFKVDAAGVAMYPSPAAKLKDSAEFRMGWDELPAFQARARVLTPDSLLAWYRGHDSLGLGQAMGKHAFGVGMLAPGVAETGKLPLKGVRIALDPGHVGGTEEMGMLEWKYVKIAPDAGLGIKDTVRFNEGNLALGTALLLDSAFRALGAEVMLTRDTEGETAFGYGYPAWLDTMQLRWERLRGLPHRVPADYATAKGWERYQIRCAAQMHLLSQPLARKDSVWWMDRSNMASVYKGPFLRAEFRERARRVQAFKPDITLIIHYNVLETNEPDARGCRKAVPDNYCMAFVPGAFMAGELGTPEDRLNFLVKLLNPADLDGSAALSAAVMQAHVRGAGVPPLPADAPLGYITRASVRLPGDMPVYARNLALTRQIHGVMCFGESLYQDNVAECVALNAGDFVLPGMTTPLPNRIRVVAQAYVDGVLGYLRSR